MGATSWSTAREHRPGEVLVWIEDGLLSSAEYAWYTDEAPDAWPDPALVRIE